MTRLHSGRWHRNSVRRPVCFYRFTVDYQNLTWTHGISRYVARGH